MVSVFSENYLPIKLHYREQELYRIRQIYENFENFDIGLNLIIRGVSGSGKTSLVKKIIQEKNNSLFVSCAENTTALKVFKALFGNDKALSTSEIISYGVEYLIKNRKILIFDEVVKVKDFVNFINILNTIYRQTSVPIILITNKFNLTKSMPEDAVKTLFFDKMNLPAYNAMEIQDILNDRLIISGIKKELIPTHVIPQISAIAGRIGSCRVALTILSRCLQTGDFSDENIKTIYQNMEKDDWFGFYQDINETERHFLDIVLEFLKPKEELGSEFLREELSRREHRNFSHARISQIINLFEKHGALVSYHKNKGRAGGRKRFVSYSSEDTYKDIIAMIEEKY